MCKSQVEAISGFQLTDFPTFDIKIKQRNMKAVLILALCQIALMDSENLYKLVKLSQDNGAACLDGSPPAIYIHEGSEENKDKFLLLFDGGGFCNGTDRSATLDSCYQRSFSEAGSTVSYPPVQNADQFGILSTDPKVNKLFHDWTKVFVIYCDGSLFFGHRKDPVLHKNRQLFFRGSNNTFQVFSYLDKNYDLYNGEKIMLTGISAGGMAAFQWSQFLEQKSQKAKVYVMPDSGIYLTDYYSPITQQQMIRLRSESLMKLVTEEGMDSVPGPIRNCTEDGSDIVTCSNAAKYAKHIKSPLFVIQSPYDQENLLYVLGVPCMSNVLPPFSLENCEPIIMKVINDYRKAQIGAIREIRGNRTDVGVWAPACVQHGFLVYPSLSSKDFRVPTCAGLSLEAAIERFLHNPTDANWNLDRVPWPWNTGCNGKNAQVPIFMP